MERIFDPATAPDIDDLSPERRACVEMLVAIDGGDMLESLATAWAHTHQRAFDTDACHRLELNVDMHRCSGDGTLRVGVHVAVLQACLTRPPVTSRKEVLKA